MSLASWPPTGWKPSDPSPTSSETPEEVFADLLKQHLKRMPTIYNKRQQELRRWVTRYNNAKQRQ